MYYHYLGLSLQFAQICPFITEEKRFHMTNITANILYTGVNDKTIDLFEGQYPVPNGISYNSYAVSYTHLQGTQLNHLHIQQSKLLVKLCTHYPNLPVI